ncbi:MAG: hypothetical protein WBV21_04000 [Desulfobacterales bacterium]|jgi:hypothetical protein
MKLSRLMIFLFLAGVLGACTVHNVQRSEPLDRQAKWAILPVSNLAEIPMAGENIESILDNALRIRGLANLQPQAGLSQTGGTLILDDRQRYEQVLKKARQENVRFGVTGAVHEWRYKTGLDGEPAVGVTLQVIDLPSGRVLWTASGAKTGWGYSNVSGTAEKLVSELLEGLALQ